LLGDWVIAPDDFNSLENLGNVLLCFRKDGILSYTILDSEKNETIILIYEVKDKMIITCQPSHPRKEETHFEIENGRLKLEFNGIPSWFVRLDEIA
jgi:hypothetical protein